MAVVNLKEELEAAARLVIADPDLPTTASLARLEDALQRIDEHHEVVRRGEIDLDGHIDAKGVRYIGKAHRQPDGTWRCLAEVQGCLCVVEVRIRPEAA